MVSATMATSMGALSSLSFHYLAKPFLTHTSFRTLHRLTCSFSTSPSSSLEFNISFAPPKPKPKLEPKPAEAEPIPDDDEGAGQLFIPWIVRGEDGKLKLQAHPPASLLQAVANSETGTKKKKQKPEKSTAEPKHSKAARRFYNENFRDSGMRLSKVLAAAGEAGQWEKVSRIRKLMKHQGVKKTPGWSSITIDGVVHKFVAGDESRLQAEEIFGMWEKLLVMMKLKGYVPNTYVDLLDVEDREKFLFRHSEKLALSFGLMKLPHRMSIRIMKNLRMREDCHAAFKLISAIENRDIVGRDRNSFHCFINGACTCREYC